MDKEWSMVSQPRAVVVGGGTNGLTAAARLAVEGWQVTVYEQADYFGGSAASFTDSFGPGTVVDFGAAAHPFGIASPAFQKLGLEEHGLEWMHADYCMAHPLPQGDAAFLHRSIDATAEGLGRDAKMWRRLHRNAVDHIDDHLENLLLPMLRWPAHPVRMAQFGVRALLPASRLSRLLFSTEKARALFCGSAVHSMTAPSQPFTSAFGVLFGALGMSRGWPVAKGGTGAIVDALLSILRAHGATLVTGHTVTTFRELPAADSYILNLTPQGILGIQDVPLDRSVRKSLERWRYGSAAHKVDWLLSGPVPWTDEAVSRASTVHVCGGVEELEFAEKEVAQGRFPDRPFVMVCQQTAADPGRGPVLWTYAHVPHGFVEEHPGQVREAILGQIERFAPGFRDIVVDHREHSPLDLETANPSIIGGDIAGGSMTGLQALFRPRVSMHPYRLASGVFTASGATPPGAGVHGMPGWWAAQGAIDHLHQTS
jgi:phytoene dehydrogenase-like protein